MDAPAPAPVVVDRTNAPHYRWGGAEKNDADGWHLLRTPELHIIEEAMPAGVSETPHHHVRARQFFYVLEGELTMELAGGACRMGPGQGIEIAPGRVHKAINRGPAEVRFLVTSQPSSHGDRVEEASV